MYVPTRYDKKLFERMSNVLLYLFCMHNLSILIYQSSRPFYTMYVHPLLSILCKHHLFILERVTIRLTVGGRGKGGGEGEGGGTRGEDGRIRWGWSL